MITIKQINAIAGIQRLQECATKSNYDVYVVWHCKTLQNWKALLSTTLPDGMYYECTLDGDKNRIYFDAYKKFENRTILY